MSFTLLQSHKAELFRLIQNVGMNPSLMRWKKRTTRFGSIVQVDSLAYADSDFYFSFDYINGDFMSSGTRTCVFSPGEDRPVERVDIGDWSEVRHIFTTWCQNLQRELSAPDPWAELETNSIPYAIVAGEHDPRKEFTVTEHGKVGKMLETLQGLMLAYAQDNEKQVATIQRGIADLKESSKTQDKQTFFYTLVGFIASTAVSMALAPEQTRSLYECAKNGLAGILTLTGVTQ